MPNWWWPVKFPPRSTGARFVLPRVFQPVTALEIKVHMLVKRLVTCDMSRAILGQLVFGVAQHQVVAGALPCDFPDRMVDWCIGAERECIHVARYLKLVPRRSIG